jgi:hypothetical protein
MAPCNAKMVERKFARNVLCCMKVIHLSQAECLANCALLTPPDAMVLKTYSIESLKIRHGGS